MRKLLAGLILLAFIAGCSTEPQMDMRVVAKAGDIEFTLYDLDCYMIRMNYKDSNDELSKKTDFLQQHLDKLITANAGVKIGLLDSIEVDSSQVERILYEILYKQEVTDKLDVTPTKVKAFWDKFGGEVHIAQIFVSSKVLADSLANVLQQSPGKFDEFVGLYSEDNTKELNNGDLGSRRVTDIPDEIRDGIFALKPGEISKPLKSNMGYHITKLLDRSKNAPADYETEKGDYRMLYTIDMRSRLQQAYGDYLKKKLHYKFDEDNYRKIADKALAIRAEKGDPSQPLSFFISPEDLTAEESKLPIVEADNYSYSAGDFVGELKKFYRRDGVNFDNIGMGQTALDFLIVPRLMSAYGKKIGLQNSPRFKRQYRDALLGTIYFTMQKDYILDTVDVTDQEIEARYEQRKNDYWEEEQIKAAEILSNTEDEAKEVMRQLKSGIPFEELVKNTVRPGFDKTNGNLGYCSERRFPIVYNAGKNKKAGEYAGPFLYDDKWAVIKITDIKPKRLKPLSEVKSQVKTFIMGGKKYEVYNKWLDEQKKTIDNYIDYDLLKSTLKTKDS